MAAPKDFFQLVAILYWLLPDDPSKDCRRRLTELPGFGRGGDIRQVTLTVALADVKGQCLMLTDDVRIVGEQMWPRRAGESIQHFGACPFDEVSHF
jgi:hypothetical protein